VRTPPTPMIGTDRKRPSAIAARTCQMARTATGRMPGPLSPPVSPAEVRSHAVGVDHHAEQGVDHRQPVGAGLDARRAAIAAMSVTSGLSLAKHRHVARQLLADQGDDLGRRQRVDGEDEPTVRDVGHEMLASDPHDGSRTRGSAAASLPRGRTRRSSRPRWTGSTRAPTDAQPREVVARRRRRCRAPCRPMELSIPEGVSAMRGVPAAGAAGRPSPTW
jgi:hypothetical protein